MNTPTVVPELVLHTLQSLVRIDSQNPVLVSGAPGERRIAEYCRDQLLRAGVESWLDELSAGRCNAVGRIGNGNGPMLVLCAHLDTVSAAGMTIPPFEGRLADGRVYGRGAYDMKGGVAAILSACAVLAQRPLNGTVLAALVADEEYASAGALDFVRHYTSDACILTEPSEERLILAHKGFVWVEVETAGTAAHGSRWDLGESAIARMGRIITALDRFDRDMLRQRVHPLVGPASLHCAMVEGGEAWSTYASHCTLRVERRTLPGETPAQVLQELESVVAECGETATLREVLSRAPLECAPDSAIAQAVAAAATDVNGAPPEVAGVGYWMDAAVFAAAGVPTVDFGPAGAGAHAAEEWVDLDSVVRCAQVLVAAATRFCNG